MKSLIPEPRTVMFSKPASSEIKGVAPEPVYELKPKNLITFQIKYMENTNQVKLRSQPIINKNVTRSTKKKVTRGDVIKLIRANTEMKYWDVIANAGVVDYSGVLTDLSLITQGVTDGDRTGDSLLPLSMEIRINVAAPTTDPGGANADQMRIMVIRWKPYSVPGTSDILNSTGGATSYMSAVNHDKFMGGNFDILFDEIAVIAWGTPNRDFVIAKYIKLGNPQHRIQYNNATTVGTNHLYLLTLSDVASGAAAGTKPYASWYIRTSYTDA